MANVYVYSGAGGAGTGADWTNAYTTLNAAFAAKAAGDTFFVAHDHAQTQASALTMTCPGTELSPCRVYCVDRGGSVPPVSADLRTTGTITTTGANAITITGSLATVYGLTFSCGTGGTSANLNLGTTGVANRSQSYSNCLFKLGTTASGSRIAPTNGGLGSVMIWDNCVAQLGGTLQSISIGSIGNYSWKNSDPAIHASSTITNTLFSFSSSTSSNCFFEGLNLSPYGSGKVLLTVQSLAADHKVTIKDCEIDPAVTTVTGAIPTVTAVDFQLIRCHDTETFMSEKWNFSGTLTTETTIVRTGGASDGTDTIAWQIDTTANASWEYPFECYPIIIWNDITGSSITVTVEGVWGGGAVPLDDEIWIDVQYLGNAGTPLSEKATSGAADGLATGANTASGSGTWGGGTTQFALSTTFTPQEKGPLAIIVKAAKPSSTFYVDPKPVIT